ncbi:MAG: CDP-paratose 2-epimerase [Acidobacteriota bacterium]|jgi:CDP-paratose 2-epimerase
MTGETVLITGGAGFVATNVADRLLRDGARVRLFDNLSRAGVEQNVRWLREQHGDQVDLQLGDVRDAAALRSAVTGVQRVFHFAAQVAVTTSLTDPFLDFDVNARGTLNLLEAIRALDDRPSLIFTSTNKVYGHLDDVSLRKRGLRYEPEAEAVARRGISEARPLDFHSPYGCSKGAAEQYVLDYARTFDLPAVVFRMSCIYGPHQFGTEDQGWVAHFLIQALEGKPLTLYGDGLQVRDILFVEDLVDAMLLAHREIHRTSGEAYNIGGGPSRTVSLLELLNLIAQMTGVRPAVSIEPWRPADQRYYVSDSAKFEEATGWRPTTSVKKGVGLLLAWLMQQRTAATREVVGGRVAS